MRKNISQLDMSHKAFLGDYDSFTIIRHHIRPKDIVTLTKLALLFFDQLVLPAAFFWQSPEMEENIPFFHQLISEEYVLPAIRARSATNDISDYFDRRLKEGEQTGDRFVNIYPEVSSEIAKESNRATAKEIQSINTFVHIDRGSVRQSFIKKWYFDILKSQSNYSISSLLVREFSSEDERQLLVNKLAEVGRDPLFSRATCIEAICSLVKAGFLRESLISRTSRLYLMANAEAYDCMFFCSKDPKNTLIFEENLFLWLKALNLLGISLDLIRALSIEEIIRIKNSIEHQQFVLIIQDLLSQAYQEQQDIINYLTRSIQNEIKRGKWWYIFNSKLQAVQNISVAVFCGLIANMFSGSDISVPVAITTGSTALATHILRKMDVFTNTNAMKIWAFRDYIIKEKYKNTIYKKIGGL